MSTFGIDSVSSSLVSLAAGEIVTERRKVHGAATKAVGQVYEWDATNAWFINKVTAGVGKAPYAVCYENSSSVADDDFVCIVQGDVDLAALDATSQADINIVAALETSGINARLVTN